MSTFNIHGTKTGDGVLIVEGLAVVTNDVEVGRVRTDRNYGCCENENHRAAQVTSGGAVFTAHIKCDEAAVEGCSCRHDHWFEVQVPTGNGDYRMVLQNGERLATVGYGRNAERECRVPR